MRFSLQKLWLFHITIFLHPKSVVVRYRTPSYEFVLNYINNGLFHTRPLLIGWLDQVVLPVLPSIQSDSYVVDATLNEACDWTCTLIRGLVRKFYLLSRNSLIVNGTDFKISTDIYWTFTYTQKKLCIDNFTILLYVTSKVKNDLVHQKQ